MLHAEKISKSDAEALVVYTLLFQLTFHTHTYNTELHCNDKAVVTVLISMNVESYYYCCEVDYRLHKC